MSVAIVPMFFAPCGVATTAVPPPPKPFHGWIRSSQCAGPMAEPFSDAQQEPQPVRQVTQAFAKTRICRFYPRCNKGDACRFAHATEELRSRPNMTKTRICAGFYDGRCKLSPDECDFAHGEQELRVREVPYFGTWQHTSSCRSICGDMTPTTSASLTGHCFQRRVTEVSSAPTSSGSGASSSYGDSTPKADEVGQLFDFQDEEGSVDGGEREQFEASDVAATPEVQAILAEWAKRIHIVTGATASGAAAGGSPTHSECLAALMKAMPDYYED